MRRNSTSNKLFFTGRFSSHLRGLSILILLVIFLAACGRSTPPGANSIWGTIEQLDLDLSGLSPTNAGIEEFGRQTPQIAAMISGSG